MYILFENASSEDNTAMYNYDCMGYAKTEKAALQFVEENPNHRMYKYCPDKEFATK